MVALFNRTGGMKGSLLFVLCCLCLSVRATDRDVLIEFYNSLGGELIFHFLDRIFF